MREEDYNAIIRICNTSSSYEEFFRTLSERGFSARILAIEENNESFLFRACAEGNSKLAFFLIQILKKENRIVYLDMVEQLAKDGDEVHSPHFKRMLITNNSNANGMVTPLYAASALAQCTLVVSELISLARGLDDNNETLKAMLLAGHPEVGQAISLRTAALNGDTDVVAQLLQAAQDLGDNNETLRMMLFAGYSDGEPAEALYIAAENGHVDVVVQLLQAAQSLDEEFKTKLMGKIVSLIQTERLTASSLVRNNNLKVIKEYFISYLRTCHDEALVSNLADLKSPLSRFIDYHQSFSLTKTQTRAAIDAILRRINALGKPEKDPEYTPFFEKRTKVEKSTPCTKSQIEMAAKGRPTSYHEAMTTPSAEDINEESLPSYDVIS